MKKSINIAGIALVSFMFLLLSQARADEVEKTLAQKKFDVNKNALLSVEHKFGRVECRNWDEMAISVKVTASVKAGTSDKASRIIDKIDVEIDGNRNGVSVETDFNKKLFDGDDHEVSIDIEIMMPENVRLDIDHQFGNAYIESAGGQSSISSQYGSIEIKALNGGANNIEIGFGEARIDYVGSGDLDVSYASASVGEADQLSIESNYSNVSVTKIRKLDIDNEGGNVDLGEADVVELSSKFSEFKIGALNELMTADTEYGSLKVRNISADFSNIEIENSFGSVTLEFNSKASFTFEADMEFCDLDYPGTAARFSEKISEATENYYKGTFGEGSAKANVKIESSFGNVTIDM